MILNVKASIIMISELFIGNEENFIVYSTFISDKWIKKESEL